MSKRTIENGDGVSPMVYEPFDTRVAFKNNSGQRVPMPARQRRHVPTVDPRAIISEPDDAPLTDADYGEEQPMDSVTNDTIAFIEAADDDPELLEGSSAVVDVTIDEVEKATEGVAAVTQNTAADAVQVVSEAIEDMAAEVDAAQNSMVVYNGDPFNPADAQGDDSRATVIYDGDAYLRDIAMVKEQWMQIELGAVPVSRLSGYVAGVMTRLHNMSNELGQRVDELKLLQLSRNQNAQNDMQMVVARQHYDQLQLMQQTLQRVASNTSTALVNVRNDAIRDAIPHVAEAQGALNVYMADTDSDDEEMENAVRDVPSVENIVSLQGAPLLRTLEELAGAVKGMSGVVQVLSSKQTSQAETSAGSKRKKKTKPSRALSGEEIRAKKREDKTKEDAKRKARKEAKAAAAKQAEDMAAKKAAQEKADEEQAREIAREVLRESDASDAATKARNVAALAKGRQGKDDADTEPVAQSRESRPLSSGAGTSRNHTAEDPLPDLEPRFTMRGPDRRRGYTRLQDRGLRKQPRSDFSDDDDNSGYSFRSGPSPVSREAPAPRSVVPQGTEVNEPFILVMAAIALLAIIKG